MKYNNTITVFIYSLLLISAFYLFSCASDNNTFTEKEEGIIDSLYKIRKKEIKTKLDTICDSVYNAQFPIMVDSIKAIRKKEILDLLEK